MEIAMVAGPIIILKPDCAQGQHRLHCRSRVRGESGCKHQPSLTFAVSGCRVAACLRKRCDAV
eukprot:COSAG01_NODE_52022_length_350_cov_0.374502_1_plen_62_part_01